VTTAQDTFLRVANPSLTSTADLPSWQSVRTLVLYTFAKYSQKIASKIDTNAVRTCLFNYCNSYKATMNSSAYQVVMGHQSGNFTWGSNSAAANQGMELLIAYKLSGDSTYLNAALSNLDYLLGRNGTTYCFVTGFGTNSPQNIHHRISAADGIAAPVPGFLVGGPNPNQEDQMSTYPSKQPALSYTDNQGAYACNEICINWNAPLVFLSIGMEAITSPNGLPTSVQQQTADQTLPTKYELLRNYPNPFNPTTTISYALPRQSLVQLKIFDMLGREVATLVDQVKKAGEHRTEFNASALPSGVYFARLGATSVGGQQRFTGAQKLLLTK
jgi:endoglucanase